jgi:hypothetical protein
MVEEAETKPWRLRDHVHLSFRELVAAIQEKEPLIETEAKAKRKPAKEKQPSQCAKPKSRRAKRTH